MINKEFHVREATVKRRRKNTNINKTVEVKKRKREIRIERMISTMIDMSVVEARKNIKKKRKKRIKNEDHVQTTKIEITVKHTTDVCSKITIIFGL